MRALMRHIFKSLGCLFFVLCIATPAAALNTMIDYTSFPPIISEPIRPNVLIMISNDHTGFYPGYNDLYNYDNSHDYWGYFDPGKEYSFQSGKFTPEGWTSLDANGDYDHYTSDPANWSGNFLNWVTMTHADFLRKALTGGQRAADATASTTIQRGDVPANHAWKKQYSGSDISNLVPSAYADNTYSFTNIGVEMDIIDSTGGSVTKNKPLNIVVATCDTTMPEDNCTSYPAGNMKPEGLLQRYHDKMYFGLMSYSHSLPDRGGILRTPVRDISNEFSQVNGSDNSSSDSMLTYIARYTEKGWDPLSEMLYDGIRYFKGNEGAQSAYCPSTQKDDNFFFYGCTATKPWVDPVQAWCQKNNIIIINDEYPSRDGDQMPNSAFSVYSDSPATGSNTPYNPDVTALTNLIGDNELITGRRWLVGNVLGDENNKCTIKRIDLFGESRGICPKEPGAGGTFYLAALAYDAFVNDMRDDLTGAQHIRTYGIAFRASPGGYIVPKPPLNQMWLTGKYGNFDDKNGNGLPDLPSEWMKDSDACDTLDPNDYDCLPKGFFYADGGSAIEDAITEVFESILQRAASGTAVSVLATSGQGEGNLVQAYYRPAISEGTRDITWTGYLQSLWVDKYGYIREDSNHNLKLDEENDSVIKYFLDTDGTTRVRRYAVSAAYPFPDLVNDSFTVIEMGGVEVVWEGGQTLVDTPSDDRNINTFIDVNNNGVIDAGEFLPLDTLNANQIQPYLALQDNFTNAYLGKTENIRANNLISFIRGNDPGLDPGSYVDPTNVNLAVRDRILGGKVWKLGDIIQSTPVSISAPPDRFDLIYGDQSYYEYYQQYKNRETMVYVGANDGMLHAFTSWQYDQSTQQFIKPAAAAPGEVVGSEIWAYVPHNLLPHLKWLARPDYTHVHYMDLQPRIFDAQIYDPTDDPATNPGGWATVMVVGMNTGGGLIEVPGDFDGDGAIDINNYNGVNVGHRKFKPSFMAFDITDPRNPKLLWERAYDGLGFTWTIPTAVRVSNADDSFTTWSLIFGNGPDNGEISGTPNYDGETNSNGRIYIVDLLTGEPKSTTANDWMWEVADERAFFNTPIAYDRGTNYKVDAAYMATTYDNDPSNDSASPHDWKGSVYRITTVDSFGDYQPDPVDWTLTKVYNSPRPITAPGALSVDHLDNTWAYFGTGRYLSKGVDSDEMSAEQEYLIGIKDPFYNKRETSYYLDLGVTKTLDMLDATPYVVLDSNEVACTTGAGIQYPGRSPFDTALPGQPCDSTQAGNDYSWTFDGLLFYARSKDGWIKALPVGTTAERSLNKPSVVGGLSLYTTFSPKGDICDYGGSSTLWALYYETGTAFKRAIFRGGFGLEAVTLGSGAAKTRVKDNFDLGSGTTSSVGIHIGKQNDKEGDKSLSGDIATGFVQQGTGTVIDFEFETAIKVRSGLRSWRER